MKAKVKQFIERQKDNSSSTGIIKADTPAPIKLTSVKHAKRLLSRMVYQMQTGEISGQFAKDLAYLLTVYIQLFNQAEMQERIEKLEKAQNEK
ncbi:MAG: hypothetical protein GXX85_17755 [Ignavibacteria bacterium]|nr:hypothetical protein [Ignavibacteria bacterium]